MKVIYDPRTNELWVKLSEEEGRKLGDEKFKTKMINAMIKAMEK